MIALTRLSPRPRPRSSGSVAAVQAVPDRGSSSGGIPMPVSLPSTASPPSGRRGYGPARRAACTSPRCRGGWRAPAAGGCGRRRRTRRRARRPSARRPFLGDVGVEVGRVAGHLRQVDRFHRSAIVPVSASEMSIRASSIAMTRSDSSRQSASASRSVSASAPTRSADSADAAQPRHRRAQVVGDVVEGAAHAGDQRLDAIEHAR